MGLAKRKGGGLDPLDLQPSREVAMTMVHYLPNLSFQSVEWQLRLDLEDVTYEIFSPIKYGMRDLGICPAHSNTKDS